MCRILKASASSPFRPAQAPNSAESTAVQMIIILVTIHDWRRAGILVVCPSSEEVSLFASNPSLSSDFTGLYDSVRFCVLMPNILMLQLKRKREKENSWKKDKNTAHEGAEAIPRPFCSGTLFYFWDTHLNIKNAAKTSKPKATHHDRISQLPR